MGGKLSQPNQQQLIQSGQTPQFKYACAMTQGWKRQMNICQLCKINVDSQIKNGNSLFAIFDGIRGLEVSHFLKETFQSVLINYSSYAQGNYQQALKTVFQKLDQQMLTQKGEKRLKQIRTQKKGEFLQENEIISNHTGSTAAVVLITKRKIFIAYNGNFKIFLMKNNQPILLTEPINPQMSDQKLRIGKAGGQIVAGRVNGDLSVSRAFGLNSFKKNLSLSWEQQMITSCPLIKVIDKNGQDDFILIGSEGFWENYQNKQEQFDKILQIKKNLQNKPQKFAQCVKDILSKEIPTKIPNESNSGYKNMSVALIKFNEI